MEIFSILRNLHSYRSVELPMIGGWKRDAMTTRIDDSQDTIIQFELKWTVGKFTIWFDELQENRWKLDFETSKNVENKSLNLKKPLQKH